MIPQKDQFSLHRAGIHSTKKPQKRKCYVITIADKFPVYHEKAGNWTEFWHKIISGTNIHTIRINADLWEKRFKAINRDEAYISLRAWSGAPYKSKQIIIKDLYKSDGIGMQTCNILTEHDVIDAMIGVDVPIMKDMTTKNWNHAAQVMANDGLSPTDFYLWFAKSKRDTLHRCAIIHFTPFRYH